MVRVKDYASNPNLIVHYSDKNLYIEQIETGNIYDIAIDVKPCKYHYKETDKPIEEVMDEQNNKA